MNRRGFLRSVAMVAGAALARKIVPTAALKQPLCADTVTVSEVGYVVGPAVEIAVPAVEPGLFFYDLNPAPALLFPSLQLLRRVHGLPSEGEYAEEDGVFSFAAEDAGREIAVRHGVNGEDWLDAGPDLEEEAV